MATKEICDVCGKEMEWKNSGRFRFTNYGFFKDKSLEVDFCSLECFQEWYKKNIK